MEGCLHERVPDSSNLLKALEDAIHADDSAIAYYAGLEKRWSVGYGIEIIHGEPAPERITTEDPCLNTEPSRR